MQREVLPELLDELPGDHSQAKSAREDLKRINWLMGNAAHLARCLSQEGIDRSQIRRLAEVGAGDGSSMLRFAQASFLCQQRAELWLIDKQCQPSIENLRTFGSWGWKVTAIKTDVLSWFAESRGSATDLLISNLFLHHFKPSQVATFLEGAAQCAHVFLACEPRRSRFNLALTPLLGFIGCGAITRHDAAISVKAGFRDQEISSAWPSSRQWQTREFAAGWFSHCFAARKRRRMS